MPRQPKRIYKPKREYNTSVAIGPDASKKLRIIATLKRVSQKEIIETLVNNAYPQYRRRLAENSTNCPSIIREG